MCIYITSKINLHKCAYPRGECVEVPIHVEKGVYDFEICLMKHCYREKLIFFNRSQNAMKIQIVPPKETKSFFEFNPILGYIQGNSKFEIWVKLNAEKEIWNMCNKFISGDLLDVPFKVKYQKIVNHKVF